MAKGQAEAANIAYGLQSRKSGWFCPNGCGPDFRRVRGTRRCAKCGARRRKA